MKSFHKIITNQKGISLVEVIVAAAMSVIVSFAVLKTNETGQKGLSKVTSDLDLKLWQQQILIYQLSDPIACLNTFEDTLPADADTSIVSLKDVGDKPFATVGNLINNTSGNWILKEIRREAFRATDGDVGLKGTCEVRLSVERSGGGKRSFGPKVKDIIIPLICSRRNDGSWSSCSAQGNNNGGLWTKHILGGDGLGYIHSNGEYVRIGSGGGNITAPLEIKERSQNDFSMGTLGVKEGLKIENQDTALVLGNNSALYEDGNGCSFFGNASSGAIERGYRHCGDGVVTLGESSSDVKVGIGVDSPVAKMQVYSSDSQSLDSVLEPSIPSYGTHTGMFKHSISTNRGGQRDGALYGIYEINNGGVGHLGAALNTHSEIKSGGTVDTFRAQQNIVISNGSVTNQLAGAYYNIIGGGSIDGDVLGVDIGGVGSGSVTNKAIGLRISGVGQADNGSYGVYQSQSNIKNYFASRVDIGSEATSLDGNTKLYVDGDVVVTGTISQGTSTRIQGGHSILDPSPRTNSNGIVCTSTTITNGAITKTKKTCKCPDGYTVLTGGGSCFSDEASLKESFPFDNPGNSGWTIECSTKSTSPNVTTSSFIRVICIKD